MRKSEIEKLLNEVDASIASSASQFNHGVETIRKVQKKIFGQ